MLSNKKSIIRTLAIVLILSLAMPTLLACSVVDSDPVILKVGDVTIHYSQFVSMCNANYQQYSSQLSDTEGLIKFQDQMFDLLKQYAMLLNKAHKDGVTLNDEERQEVEDAVKEEMDAFTQSYVSQVKKDDTFTPGKLETMGYGLTDDDQEAVDAKLEELLNADLTTYRNNVDSSITDSEAKDAAARELLEAELAKEGKTYDEYKNEKTEEAKTEVMWNKYATVEAEKLRDEYIKKSLNMTIAAYEKELRDSYTDNKLVEKVEQSIRDERTLKDGEAKEWYDDQVAKLTEEYAKDTSGYYSAQNSYDTKGEDDITVQPLVVPEGYIRVKHILLATPDPSAEAAASEEPAMTDAPATEETTEDPEATATEPVETEDVDATDMPETTTPPETEETTDEPATTEPAADETAEAASTEPAETEDTTAEPAETEAAEEKTTTVAQEDIDKVQAAINAIDPNADKLAAFDELIALYNDDPGMSTEPYSETGYLVSESIVDAYLEGFAEAALALENVGDISGPVITTAGVHFIQLIEKVEARTVPYEEAQEEVEAYVLNLRQAEYVEETLAEMEKTVTVTEWRSRIRSYSPTTFGGSSSISLG